MDSQLAQYVPVLILALVAFGFAGFVLVASVVIGRLANQKIHSSKIKDTAYECGMLPIGEANSRLSIKFYLVAMLFILFDIEVVFLYPWAVVYKGMLTDVLHPEYRNMIFGSMVSFLGILFVGYIYALKKHAFDWKS